MFEEGQRVLLRTVTFHHVGEVVEIDDRGFLHLKDASWVADSGRFGVALESGSLSEAEFVGETAVNLATVVDVFPWAHPLPTQSV